MRFGSVCSGIEAASVAWYRFGWRAAWLSEVDPAASAVLAFRFPEVTNLGDMTAIAPMIEARVVEAPDVLVGGTPCQGYSVAGRRGGLSDPRGQLTLSYVEILDAIDDARREAGKPECIAVWENVPGVLSMRDNSFGNFLAALAGEELPLEPSGKRWPDAGVVLGPKRAIAWRILDAQFIGLAQRRKRVFVVASARDGFDPGEILLEFDGVRRDSPPSRQAQQGAPGAADTGTECSGVAGTVAGEPRLTNRLIDQRAPVGLHETVGTLCADTHPGAYSGQDAYTGRIIPVETASSPIAFTAKDHGQDATDDLSPTLRSGGHSDSHANGGVMPAIAYSIRTAQTGANGIGVDEHIAPTLDVSGAPSVCYGMTTEQTPKFNDDCALTLTKQSPTGGGQPQAVVYGFQPRIGRNGRGDMGDVISALTAEAGTTGKGDAAPCVAYAIQERAICENPNAGPDGMGVREDVAYTLEARQTAQAVGLVSQDVVPFDTTQITHPENRSNPQPGDPCHPLAAGGHAPSIIGPSMAVRKLMPVECERLQGFPDNWTRIPIAFHVRRKVTKLRPEDMWERGTDLTGKEGWWLMAADGPRYKQCGNSMAVTVMAWIGGRIKGWLELAPFRELIG